MADNNRLSKPGLIPVKVENQGSLITTQVNKINFSGSGVTASVGQFNDLNVTIGGGASFPYTGSAQITGSLGVTGSSGFSGSITQIGNTLISGSLTISGSSAPGSTTASVQIYGDTSQTGYIRLNPVTTNIDNTISASYIYVSGSTNDLYFTQNGEGYANTTRLRWIEGNLYTGLLHGGLISTQSSTVFQVQSGSGIIVKLNASIPNDPYPTVQYLSWPTLSASIAPLSASFDQSFVSINSSSAITVQGTPYNDGDYNTLIPIGIVLHQNHSTINAFQTFPSVGYGWKQRSFDFIKAFGPLKISGYTLIPSGSSTGSLYLTGGTSWVDGRNYTIDPNNPSYITEAVGIATSKIFRYYQSGSSWGYDTNNGTGYASIDPTKYSLNGVLTSVASNDWSIQRVFYFPNSATKALYIYYGNLTYPNKTDAIAGILTEPFSEAPNTAANAIFVGYMLLRNDANFTVGASYEFRSTGLFRAAGGGGGTSGGGGITTPGGSSTQIQYNNAGGFGGVPVLTYDGTTLRASGSFTGSFTGSLFGTSSWSVSSSQAVSASRAFSSSYALNASNALSSSNAFTASYSQTASFVTEAQTASFVLTAQTASYVLTAQTASFVLTSQTASYVLQAVSASFSTLANTSNTASYTTFAVTSSQSLNAVTASYILNAVSSSYALSASSTLSASYALSSSIALTASNANSSSLIYIASNPSTDVNYTLVFKNNSSALDNYHPLAADGTNGPYYNPSTNILGGVGGITISGSIGRFNTITGSTSITGSFTGSLLGTSSFATTASYALSTRAFPYTGSAEITGSLDVTGSIRQVYPTTNTSASQEYIDMTVGLGTIAVFIKPFAIPMSVFLEYFIIDTISGADQRAGTIMASFNSTGTPTEVFTETTTNDIGNTTAVTFAAVSTPNFEIRVTNTGFNAYQLRGTLRYY